MLKISAYTSFIKLRLSILVLVSALSGYLFAGGDNYIILSYLLVGGFFITAASNGANQIWEKELDKLMDRTKNRPLPTKKMNLTEAYIIVVFCFFIGLILLYQINIHSFILGLLSFFSYVFLYTPLKKHTPWSVLIGAFPGAVPPMLGAIAHTNQFGLLPGVLFFVQFTWQFPHFWAIAWVAYEDYQKAGFSLLPSKKGRSKDSAFQIMFYSLTLIPFSLLPWLMDWCGEITLISASILGGLFFLYSYRLFISCENKDAKKLMFASFAYLPIIQFIYVFDKL